MNLDEVKKLLDKTFVEAGKVIVGQEEMLKQILVAVMTDSHALIEGYPGLAKTLTVSTLSRLLDLKFSRIQNTPDLMPSDILGTYIIEDARGKREFKFQSGPIFANIVLADELNRASPKTQSAYLEAMQERQVTMGNNTFKLDRPFFVLATQNPIEQEGSLTLDQPVFIDGQLKTGYQLMDDAAKLGCEVIEKDNKKLYLLPNSYTLSLNSDGKLEKTKCVLYTLPYDGQIVRAKTRQGRSIKVSGNHPFLVNYDGRLMWKKAEELQLGDYLVSPSKVSCDIEKTCLMSHEAALKEVSKKYKVVRSSDLIKLQKKTKGFKKEKLWGLCGSEFDKLRVSSLMSIKMLSKKLRFDRNDYWQLIRFLRRDTHNLRIRERLVSYFCKHKPKLEGKDYVEAFTVNSVKPFKIDEDVVAWLAFLQSDGSVGKSYLSAHQKNYPAELQRFVDTAVNKLGVHISGIYRRPGNHCSASVRSAPIALYFKLRFGMDKHNVPTWLISLPSNLRRAYLKTFISLESHLDIENKRITFTQKDTNTVNVIRYMLLMEGITTWLKKRKNGSVYDMRISGKDLLTYLGRIGWVDGNRVVDFFRKVPKNFGYESTHRVIPLPKQLVMGVCKTLGLNSFHAYKNRKKFLDNDWYFAYKAVQQGGKVVSTNLFKKLVAGFKEELAKRENLDFDRLICEDVHRAAVTMGIPITELSKAVKVSNDYVCGVYDGKREINLQMRDYLKEAYSKKLKEVLGVIEYLDALASEDVVYDKVVSLSVEDFNGIVYGLTVPGLQNYVAGFGACGINHNTFPLPEAQADRFLLKIKVDYPTFTEEMEIVDRFTETIKSVELKPVLKKDILLDLQGFVRQVPIANDIKKYAVDLVTKTRNKKDLIEYGASPRASIGLILAAKAHALIEGRKYVSKEDINHMAFPILRHRIILSFEAERNNLKEDDVIKGLLK